MCVCVFGNVYGCMCVCANVSVSILGKHGKLCQAPHLHEVMATALLCDLPGDLLRLLCGDVHASGLSVAARRQRFPAKLRNNVVMVDNASFVFRHLPQPWVAALVAGVRRAIDGVIVAPRVAGMGSSSLQFACNAVSGSTAAPRESSVNEIGLMAVQRYDFTPGDIGQTDVYTQTPTFVHRSGEGGRQSSEGDGDDMSDGSTFVEGHRSKDRACIGDRVGVDLGTAGGFLDMGCGNEAGYVGDGVGTAPADDLSTSECDGSGVEREFRRLQVRVSVCVFNHLRCLGQGRLGDPSG